MKDVNGQHDDLIVSNAGPLVDAAIHRVMKDGTVAVTRQEVWPRNPDTKFGRLLDMRPSTAERDRQCQDVLPADLARRLAPRP